MPIDKLTLELAEIIKQVMQRPDNIQSLPDLETKCKQVCGNAMWYPVYLMMQAWPNDALHWAQSPESYDMAVYWPKEQE